MTAKPDKPKPKPPKSEKGREGKKAQLWTQRALERAQRAAPNRTIIIRRDGSIELPPPVSESGDRPPPNPWEQEE